MKGKRIRELRKRINVTRKEFWEKTGFIPSTLSKLETGKGEVTISKARLLSTLFIYRFGLDPLEASEEYILTGTLPENKNNLKFIPSR